MAVTRGATKEVVPYAFVQSNIVTKDGKKEEIGEKAKEQGGNYFKNNCSLCTHKRNSKLRLE